MNTVKKILRAVALQMGTAARKIYFVTNRTDRRKGGKGRRQSDRVGA